MKSMVRMRNFATFLSMIILLSASLVAFRPPEAPAAAPEMRDGERAILLAGETDNFFRVPAPANFSRSATPTAIFLVDYSGGWDPEAQAAFQFAVDIWSSIIVSSVPIRVNAEWTALGPGVLGSAGPEDFIRDFLGAPQASTWYPIGLANALANQDLSPTEADIGASFSSNFTNWYFGTDGNTPAGKYDFVSVVLHELGHGLGFLGSGTVSSGVGRYGIGTPSFPLTYDRFVQNGSAQPLLSFTSPSTALADQLTGSGGGLFFNGTKANAANGGAPAQLYTPVIFQQGSSYSHLNENTFNNTGNALMTPQIDTAETLHAPGPVTLGMFEDMGWSITPQQPTAEPDLSIVAQSPNTALIPGGGITITLSVANTNTAKAEEVTVTNILPTEILTLTWESTFSQITQAGGPDFIWNLTELAVNETGVISVYGTIDPSVSMTSTILISATIATTSTETNTTNNSAALLFGGKRLYLPTIVK